MKQFYLPLALLASVAVNAQIINTVAGTTGGFSGNGGAATSAQLATPEDVKPDASGNFYISEFGNNCSRKVTAGIINLYQANGIAGFSGDGGLAVSAEMNISYGCAFDGIGNVYSCDFSNNRIRKVTPTGFMLEWGGNGTGGFSGDGGQATAAELSGPASLCCDAANNLYIGDWYNNVVRKINIGTGIITTVAGNHTAGFSGDGGQATAAELQDPEGVFVDGAGNLWIADTYNYRIRKVNAAGVITTVCGTGVSGSAGNGGQATAAQLGFPRGVCVAPNGDFYIADQQSEEIRKVTFSTGIISDYAGNGIGGLSGDGGPATAAELDFPDKCFLDNAGNLYISDLFNNRIRKVGNVPLPVTWLDFNAAFDNSTGNVELNWSTASEVNNKTFVVEHSTDGSNFADLTRVRGAGNSSNTNYYSVLDEHPATGINYYRIKQIDFDGMYSYSLIKPAEVTSSSFIVFPNPAAETVNIAYNAVQPQTSLGLIKIYNLLGSEVATKQVAMLAGTNTYQLDLAGLNNGLYLIVFNNGLQQFTSRIVVNKSK